ncbi:hypothetical protein BBP40_012148 [Aspergillus hancockii]|nr:hypothetical protein BBP40_012148 [Aspergillus hancockii]
MTLRGENYEYRLFDSGDHIIAHAESESRVKRMMHGMRYERGGKSKYWIPTPGEINSRTPLLASAESSRRGSALDRFRPPSEVQESILDEGDEQLFTKARALEFGDWNYPVITASQAPHDQRLAAPFRSQNFQQPDVVKKSRKHRKVRPSSNGRTRSNGDSTSSKSRREHTEDRPSLQRGLSSSASRSSPRSQLVDLVVEDREAEEKEREEHQRATGSALLEPEHRYFHGQAEPSQTEGPSSPSERRKRPTKRNGGTYKDDPETRVWSYEGLEEDNVWGQ